MDFMKINLCVIQTRLETPYRRVLLPPRALPSRPWLRDSFVYIRQVPVGRFLERGRPKECKNQQDCGREPPKGPRFHLMPAIWNLRILPYFLPDTTERIASQVRKARKGAHQLNIYRQEREFVLERVRKRTAAGLMSCHSDQ